MSTINVVLRNYKKKDGTQPLELKIRSGDKTAPKGIDVSILAKDWDAVKQRVRRSHPDYAELNDIIEARLSEAKEAKNISLKKNGVLNPKKVINAVLGSTPLIDLVLAYRKKMLAEGKERRAQHIQQLADAVNEYRIGTTAQEVDDDWISDFDTFLKAGTKKRRPAMANTRVGYLNRLRTVFNKSNIPFDSPFKTAKIGAFKSSKDIPLTIEQVKKLMDYEPRTNNESLAKDTWLFSFFTSGLRSADILTLQWSQIRNGRIIIEPDKTEDSTGVVLSIPITKEAQKILDRYDQHSVTVFGMLPINPHYKLIESKQAILNSAFKSIALHGGLPANLKAKLARTTFAHHSQGATSDIFQTQKAMGHATVKTTQIYLELDIVETDVATNAIAVLFTSS